MVKYSEAGSSTFTSIRFAPSLTSYAFFNDGAATLTVQLDGALLDIPAGSGISSSAGERLGRFGVPANASSSAWRFIGSDN